ncbi:unnamed protein product, partial [Prunus brigantina]
AQVFLGHQKLYRGYLGPTWEGLYEVTKVCHLGTYQLRDPNGKTLPHPWNVDHLKKNLQASACGTFVVAGSGAMMVVSFTDEATAVALAAGLIEGGTPLVSKN